ncbi:BrnA antitoxin family protein [Gellertiella hungarica]|uniref:Uncharacterized protein (DUF4415 family) n=1 Tax=Gellertiella hungarica TaxID=1572859 RepID=A0A7W6J279_9HYPH|nr:BrnA antitoxin family protein [Gellertiella hungarica]MBB4063451.1 uncharacterized protein (DUF4415 family) [Gellertiella hungarica]
MIANSESKTDWARVEAMTDEEIEAAIKDDPDWEGWEDIDWSKAVWVVPRVKRAISIRLDSDIIEFFKKEGPGYQSRMNDVLRFYMESRKKAAE